MNTIDVTVIANDVIRIDIHQTTSDGLWTRGCVILSLKEAREFREKLEKGILAASQQKGQIKKK